MNGAQMGSGGDVEEAEDGTGAAGGVDAGLEEVVEGEGVFGIGAGHVDVETAVGGGGEFGEGEVVGGERAEGSVSEEISKDGGGGSAAVFGVGAAEDLVDKEEDGGCRAGGNDGGEAFDFCEELGAAFGERVGEREGSADVERGEAEGLSAHGRSGKGEDCVDADGAKQS